MIPMHVPDPESIGLKAAIAQLERENGDLRARVKMLRQGLVEIAKMAVVSRMRLYALATLHNDRRPGP